MSCIKMEPNMKLATIIRAVDPTSPRWRIAELSLTAVLKSNNLLTITQALRYSASVPNIKSTMIMIHKEAKVPRE